MKLAAAALAVTALCFAAAGTAVAETRRIAVVVGSNVGSGVQAPLRFAENDAGKLAAVLTELGGLPAADLFLLQGQTLASLRATLRTVADRVLAWRRQANTRVVLLFYFSGHSDGQALEIGHDRYQFGELRRWLTATGADVRLAIVDTCKSGALLAVKGATRAPAFDIHLASDPDSTGEVLLTSSAADENALESREIRGSFFSHHLVSGLRGAADSSGDGQITLAEAYQYAFVHTVSATAATLAGPQHPAFDFRLSGQGELVLTQLARPSAIIAIPGGFDRILVAYPKRDQIVAELTVGSADRVAVAPGAYALYGWRGGQTFAARLTVAAGEARLVRADEFAPFASLDAQAKGEESAGVLSATPAPAPEALPSRQRLQLLVAGGADRSIASSLGALPALRLSMRGAGRRAAMVTLDVGSGRGSDFRETRAALLGGFALARQQGRGRLFAAVEAGGGLAFQAADHQALRWTAGATAGVAAGASWRVTDRLALAIEGHAPVTVIRRDDRLAAAFLPAAWLGVLLDL
ncbi:MAG TPA: caspase family protein [Polyangia bacterium]|nr:caspase family protein [Polyangia bacterium]